MNLRCFDQKRRFGFDLLYPTSRLDIVVSLDQDDPEEAAARIIAVLVKRGLLPSSYAL